MPPCSACLGDRMCWVCTGNGLLDVREQPRFIPCHRCYGSGKCFACQQIAVVDIQQPPPVLRMWPWRRGSAEQAS